MKVANDNEEINDTKEVKVNVFQQSQNNKEIRVNLPLCLA